MNAIEERFLDYLKLISHSPKMLFKEISYKIIIADIEGFATGVRFSSPYELFTNWCKFLECRFNNAGPGFSWDEMIRCKYDHDTSIGVLPFLYEVYLDSDFSKLDFKEAYELMFQHIEKKQRFMEQM